MRDNPSPYAEYIQAINACNFEFQAWLNDYFGIPYHRIEEVDDGLRVCRKNVPPVGEN